MPVSFDAILSSITLFAAPFLRLSAMMAVAPVFSAAGFNVRTRALFAVLIAALVAPSLPTPPVDSLLSAAGVLMAIREIGVGLILGFAVQLAFGSAATGIIVWRRPGLLYFLRATGQLHQVLLVPSRIEI